MKKAYLYLANGQVLEGQSFGASGTAIGELVFTTSMTGCVESLTDPSYYGQLVVYTFPLFGYYGICRKDMESPHSQMAGVGAREYCQEPSNFRCDATVDTFLKEQNVVGIAGVDTRMLTQMIRDGGVMNAIITTEETKPDLEVLKTYRVEQSVENTSTKEAYDIPAQGEEKFSVALLDYGATGVVIDHDLDGIRNADYVIDMGPGGGESGGRVVATGTPEEIQGNPESITGRYL